MKSVVLMFVLLLANLFFLNDSVQAVVASEWTFKTSDKVNIYVYEKGAGSPIIVIHGGWGAEHSYLIKPFEFLTDSHRLVFYDMRGSLRSRRFDTKPRPAFSVENHLSDLEELRRELKIEKVTLIAHSMGTFLAMDYLQKFGSHVEKVILIAPVPADSSIEMVNSFGKKTMARCHSRQVLALLKENDIPAVKNCDLSKIKDSQKRATAHRITQAGINLHNPKRWSELEGLFFFQNDAANEGATSMPAKWSYLEALKTSKDKVLVIQGDDDYIPPAVTKNWTTRANVTLIMVPQAGHIPWIERQKEISAAVIKFMNK